MFGSIPLLFLFCDIVFLSFLGLIILKITVDLNTHLCCLFQYYLMNSCNLIIIIFCSIINIFNVSFDQFKMSLYNIHFLKKFLTSTFWTVVYFYEFRPPDKILWYFCTLCIICMNLFCNHFADWTSFKRQFNGQFPLWQTTPYRVTTCPSVFNELYTETDFNK